MEKTAGIIIIGNEILSGKVEDTNARYLITELRDLGVALRMVTIIPDNVTVVAETVLQFSNTFDFVFTSGGIGPTHDDKTIEGVAKAFGTSVIQHPDMVTLLQAHYGEALNESRLRLALVPDGTELIRSGFSWLPVYRLNNVYVLPGVPELFRNKFASIRERFRDSPYFLKVVYIREGEGTIASILKETEENFESLQVGSYPRFDTHNYRVKVTLESKNKEIVEQGLEYLLTHIPAHWIHAVE